MKILVSDFVLHILLGFQYHPSGQTFATASEDKSARLFDIRSDQQIASYAPPNANSGFTSCALSLSGRYILCGSDDNDIHAWDTLKTCYNGKDISFLNFVVEMKILRLIVRHRIVTWS